MSERTTYEDIVASARKSGDRTYLARSLHSLGNICAREGAISNALKYLEESKLIWHESRESDHEASVCFSLASVYDVALHDDDRAIRFLEEGLALDPSDKTHRGILESKKRNR